MEIDIGWLAILGFALGLAACLRWLWHDITALTGRPRLMLSHHPFAINWQSIDTDETRRFVHFEATNRKGVARHCIATARIISHPSSVTDMPALQKAFLLHWADTPYSTVSTKAEPVDIRKEARRLDIVFTTSRFSGQSWLATPLALAAPGKVPEATLPPGEYLLKVTVSCENGGGDSRRIRLTSPADWPELAVEPA